MSDPLALIVPADLAPAGPDSALLAAVDRAAAELRRGAAVLVSADGYVYGGKTFDSLARLRQIVDRLPSVRSTIVVPHLGGPVDLGGIRGATLWPHTVGGQPAEHIAYERLPFDHPLSNVHVATSDLLEIGPVSGESGTGGSAVDVATGRIAGVPMPATNVHPIPVAAAIAESQGPDWAAERYEAELIAAGKASIMVPFPFAADDHQRKNAEALQSAGAARMILQQDLSGETLAAEIEKLVQSPQELDRMEEASRQLAHGDAAAAAVDMIEELSQKKAQKAQK